MTERAEMSRYLTIFFFFFQAEDGIRDLIVTGVQTCALPICPAELRERGRSGLPKFCRTMTGFPAATSVTTARSVEIGYATSPCRLAAPVMSVGRLPCRARE